MTTDLLTREDDLLTREELQPQERQVWDFCTQLLELGVKPTPGMINAHLGKTGHRLNGRLCRIRCQLLDAHGWERVYEQRGFGQGRLRWKKKMTAS